MNIFEPQYRYRLRARIHETGHRTIAEFSKNIGIDQARVSRVLTGWEIPSQQLGEAMAKELNISIEQLKELL